MNAPLDCPGFCTLSGLADVNVRCNSRCHLVRPRDISFNRIYAVGTNKVYRASTQPTTRHASAMTPGVEAAISNKRSSSLQLTS